MSTDLRRKALRRANLRTFVQGWLGNDDYAWVPGNNLGWNNLNVRQDIDLVTLRLNYRFGGPVIAKY